jgi:acyl-CoA synthetase (NDP forming)
MNQDGARALLAGVLAADACAAHGLNLHTLSPTLTAASSGLLPTTASLGNPIDTTAGVSANVFSGASVPR